MFNDFINRFYLGSGNANNLKGRMARGNPIYKGVSNTPNPRKFKNLGPIAKKRIRGQL